jgi:hypothetical protein
MRRANAAPNTIRHGHSNKDNGDAIAAGWRYFTDRFRGRLIEIGRDAKKTSAIATAYPTNSAAIVTPMTFQPLRNGTSRYGRRLWPMARANYYLEIFAVLRVTAPSRRELYKQWFLREYPL